ncbi:hypothetical protein GCM10011491_19040 [Brucella endophytica]|uniref:Helix-turn-helix domain-containing protein n=1 Tax=Brucella endophytica TaxID=1963359 RepID=A0A916SAY9_9HYPH|nr:helix-turn-helix domain-containing protein [Brucella endophytica]GGA91226.1 hypothetical protein GCM10011491_19040 [Brucella endophytica]
MTNQTSSPNIGKGINGIPAEKFLTVATAAAALGVHTWALRRAIKNGAIPAYTPFNSRILVRLSEVVAAIDASKTGSAR